MIQDIILVRFSDSNVPPAVLGLFAAEDDVFSFDIVRLFDRTCLRNLASVSRICWFDAVSIIGEVAFDGAWPFVDDFYPIVSIVALSVLAPAEVCPELGLPVLDSLRVDGCIVVNVKIKDSFGEEEHGQVEEDGENLRANNAHLPVHFTFPSFRLLVPCLFLVFVGSLCEEPIILLDAEVLVVGRHHLTLILLLLRRRIKVWVRYLLLLQDKMIFMLESLNSFANLPSARRRTLSRLG